MSCQRIRLSNLQLITYDSRYLFTADRSFLRVPVPKLLRPKCSRRVHTLIFQPIYFLAIREKKMSVNVLRKSVGSNDRFGRNRDCIIITFEVIAVYEQWHLQNDNFTMKTQCKWYILAMAVKIGLLWIYTENFVRISILITVSYSYRIYYCLFFFLRLVYCFLSFANYKTIFQRQFKHGKNQQIF